MNTKNLKIFVWYITAENVEKYKFNFDEKSITKFENTYKFCNEDLNKFTLSLRKGVYHQKYIDSWSKFKETLLRSKDSFYSSLIFESLTTSLYKFMEHPW